MKLSNSSMVSGSSSWGRALEAAGAGGGAGLPAAEAAAGGEETEPLVRAGTVWGSSTADEAMSSSLEVAASSL